jgi:hypothetical protein
MRYLIALVAVVLAGTGIAVRVHMANAAKERLAKTYPRLEALLAIYSLFNWRSPEQRPPKITEKTETGGSELTLDCPSIQWGKGGFDRSDSLFSCFTSPRIVYVPEEGKKVKTIQLISAEEYSYRFAWDSIFGYEMQVNLRGYEAFEENSPIRKEREACLQELERFSNRHETCSFHMYRVRLGGLSVAKSVSFITADGHLTWNPDGTVNRRRERVIYLTEDSPVTLGQLNSAVQKTLRALGIAESDLSKVAPSLEVMWMGKDEAFLRALVAELDKIPDLTKLSGFIQGK